MGVVKADRYQQWIEREVRKQRFGSQPVSLYEPIRYLMGMPGKRLRPMLTLMGYSLFADDPQTIVRYAVAVEAFHNFTLMHDDIMDEAPLRRGQQTVHTRWNTNTAILSGDVMLVKVYSILQTLPPPILHKVLPVFNACATEVCEGQQWDMEFESLDEVSEAEYLRMIRQKTAVLLGFALEFGALLAGAPDRDCKALRKFGTDIGIGFQLRDDLLDTFGDPKKFGKQVGGDIISNKKTFLLIKANALANRTQATELERWIASKRSRKKKKVEAVKALYLELNIPALTERKANRYFKSAFRTLDTVRCSVEAKTSLRAYADQLVMRQS
jgi:geranylgeranyl diphosphate synthase type II